MIRTHSSKTLFFVFFIFSLFTLFGCGGGGGDSGSPNTPSPGGPTTPPPTQTSALTKIQNAADYSSSELREAAQELADANYSGKTSNAEVTYQVAQDAYSFLFGGEDSAFPDFEFKDFSNDLDGNGKLNKTYICDKSGSAKYTGKIQSDGKGKLTITYSSCDDGISGVALNGSIALDIQEVTESTQRYVVFFGDTSFLYEGATVNIFGYSTFNYLAANNSITSEQFLTAMIRDETYKLVASVAEDEFETRYRIEGDLYISSTGKLEVSLNALDEYPPYLNSSRVLLIGSNRAALYFENGPVKFVTDSDGDDQFDVGLYFSTVGELLNSSVERPLNALDMLSSPPVIYEIYLETPNNPSTQTPIKVATSFYDNDTASTDINVSFRWFLNDELVPNQAGDTLPPFIAAYGDLLEVSSVVTDGTSVIESKRLQINLENSPAVATIENMPESIMAGDIVKFNVSIEDPDIGTVEGAKPILLNAPDGVTLDDKGIVTWNVPANLQFPEQYFYFYFTHLDASEMQSDVTEEVVKVTSSSEKMTQGRAELEPSRDSRQIHLAIDFDRDGQNELIMSTERNAIFSVKVENENYVHSWLNPYSLPVKGGIIEVFAGDHNADGYMDIYVVTQQGVAVFTDPEKMPETLMTTESYIEAATTYKNNGRTYLAYFTIPEDITHDEGTINVSSLDSLGEEPMSFAAAYSKQIEVGNVDADQGLEIVTNTGEIFNLASGERKWMLSSEFGYDHIALADLTGDGLKEIIGAEDYGVLNVYSAETRTQLTSIEQKSSCELEVMSTNSQDYLMHHDCGYQGIQIVELNGNQLEERLRFQTTAVYPHILPTIDIDTDGQVEIVWYDENNVYTVNIEEALAFEATLEASSISSLPSVINSSQAVGWAKNALGDTHAIFYVDSLVTNASSAAGYLSFSADNIQQTANLTPPTTVGINSAIVIDSNSDGIDELAFPIAEGYSSSASRIAGFELDNQSLLWQLDFDELISVQDLVALDMNADGHQDIFIREENVISIVDVEFDRTLAKYDIGRIRTAIPFIYVGTSYVALSTYDNSLKILKLTENGLVEVTVINDQDCFELEVINADTDAEKEIVCLQNNSELVTFEFSNNQLVEQSKVRIDYRFLHLTADSTKTENQGLLAVGSPPEIDISVNFHSDTLLYLSIDGKVKWRSPGISASGNVVSMQTRQNEQGELEIQYASENMMLWFK